MPGRGWTSATSRALARTSSSMRWRSGRIGKGKNSRRWGGGRFPGRSTRGPLAVGVDFFQRSSRHEGQLCPVWGKGHYLSAGIGSFYRILPRGSSKRALSAFFALSQRPLIPCRLNGGMPKPTRVEAGRRRAQRAKRAVTVAAATGFVVALALVRQGHPVSTRASANSRSSQSGSTSSSATRRGFQLGGGSIGASSGGAAPLSTSTS